MALHNRKWKCCNAFAFSAKLKSINLNNKKCDIFSKMAFKFPDVGSAKWQAWLDKAEREMQELMQLQNPPPPIDVGTQTDEVKPTTPEVETTKPVFTPGRNPLGQPMLDCCWEWHTKFSLTIVFTGTSYWNNKWHPMSPYSHQHAIQNAICSFLKKGKRHQDYLFKNFGNRMDVTHGLHITQNDPANPQRYPHFNALDFKGRTVHVYCKPHYNTNVSIFSFSKILINAVSDI
jgi:hypothetical protein